MQDIKAFKFSIINTVCMILVGPKLMSDQAFKEELSAHKDTTLVNLCLTWHIIYFASNADQYVHSIIMFLSAWIHVC